MNKPFYITFTFLIYSLIVSGQPGPSQAQEMNYRENPDMMCISFSYKKDTIKWGDERFKVYCSGTSQIKETRTYLEDNHYGYDSLTPVYHAEEEYFPDYQIFPIDSQFFCFAIPDEFLLPPIVIKFKDHKDSTVIFAPGFSDGNFLINRVVYDKRVHQVVLCRNFYNPVKRNTYHDKQRRHYILLNYYYDMSKANRVKEENRILVPTR